MDYRRFQEVFNQVEAKQVMELLAIHGISSQIMECPKPEGGESSKWIVLVYEPDYVRAKFVIDEA